MIPGTSAKVKIARDGKEKLIEVTLGKLSENPNELIPGVSVLALTNETRRRLGIADPRIAGGVVITDVSEDSPFRERLVPDVVIIEINQRPVRDLESAKAALKKTGENDLFAVIYRGQIRFVVVNVSKTRK